MPQKDKHMNWATHDRNFWTSIDLDSSPYRDWAVTGMFYEAVHWIEAFLAIKPYHSHDHKRRELAMLRLWTSDFAEIAADFIDLKKDSETARYHCYKHTANEIRQVIPLVDNVKNHISALL